MLFRRALANFVDVFIFVAMVVAMFMFVMPFLVPLPGPEGGEMSLAWAALALLGIAGFYLAVQWPFYMNNQTVGKAFFRMRVKSTNNARPLTATIILQREIFAKIFTAYFMCLPVIWGGQGFHDAACETEVEAY